MASTRVLPRLPLFEAISSHDPTSTAIVHSDSGRTFTYGDLLRDVADARQKLVAQSQDQPLKGERVAFLIENGYDYVVTFLSILASHALALPLASSFPTPELRYIMNHSQARLLLASEKMWSKAEEVLQDEIETQPSLSKVNKIYKSSTGIEHVTFEDVEGADEEKGGMMLYTSGTTSRPKGVVLPARTLHAQSQSLLSAWEYTTKDRLLHVLPLHHIHGTQNALLTPLLAGSTIEFMFPFSPEAVWNRFAAPFLNATSSSTSETKKPVISFFTVVPTIYSRLLDSFPKLPENIKPAAKEAIKVSNLRLPISGSAALPAPTRNAWHDLSDGNVLLERYGMTEVGMALSCGLSHEDRIEGSVGWPLPHVEARIVDSENGEVIEEGKEKDADGKERQGEIQLRGATVFSEYFHNPDATAKEFTKEPGGEQRPWFKTGDVAVRRYVDGAGKSDRESQRQWTRGPAYFIQGRLSSDIIKSGGEKVSALEVEREMLALEQIKEVSVVGVKSEKWGQKVSAICVLKEGWIEGKPEDKGKSETEEGGKKRWTPLDMRRALKSRLVPYKIPQELKCVETMPRNAMGKVNKKQLVKDVFGEDA